VVVDHRLAASCACLPQAGWAGAEPYLTRASVCLTLPWELCDKTLPNSAAATNAISQSVPDTTLPLFYCVGAWLRWQAAIRSACLCAVYHRLQRDTCSPFWAHIVTIHHICTWFLADCKATFPETYMPVANRAADNLCSPGVFARASLSHHMHTSSLAAAPYAFTHYHMCSYYAKSGADVAALRLLIPLKVLSYSNAA
jgi:hypothetical protein